MNLNKKFKIDGLWHLPTSDNKEIGGILTFHPKFGAKIKLIGFLQEPKETYLKPEKGSYFEVIHGVLESGELVTLIDCFRINYKANVRMKISISLYSVRLILIGIHLEKRSLAIFDKASFQINVFPQWMRRNIVKKKLFYSSDEYDGFELKFLKSKNQDTYSYEIDPNLKMEFKSYAGIKEVNFSDYELKSNYSIILSFNELRNFSFILEESNRFISFLRLCFSDCVYFLNFYFHIETGVKEDSLSSWKRIFFKQRYFKKQSGRSLYMHISYEDLKDKIDEILVNWMILDKRFDPIIETLTELNERGKEFTIKDFLNITQCVDGFHRMAISPSRTQFIHRIKKIISDFDYVNRLQFSEVEIQRIVDNRDYYTHLHLDKEVELFSMPELYKKTRQLYSLLLFSLLVKIGFTKDMIIKYSEDPYLY